MIMRVLITITNNTIFKIKIRLKNNSNNDSTSNNNIINNNYNECKKTSLKNNGLISSQQRERESLIKKTNKNKERNSSMNFIVNLSPINLNNSNNQQIRNSVLKSQPYKVHHQLTRKAEDEENFWSDNEEIKK